MQTSLEIVRPIIEIDRMGKKADLIIASKVPKNTRRAYEGDILYFKHWLEAIGIRPEFPVPEETIIQFIFHHLESMPEEIERKLLTVKGGKKDKGPLSTVKRRIKMISTLHKIGFMDDPYTQRVKKLIIAFSKSAPLQKKAKAITKDILIDMLNTCKNDKLIDVRDKAMLLFGWSSGGRRRSEIADAEFKDLEALSNGNYTYTMPRNKTDQEGHGNKVPINGVAARSLKNWLQLSSISEGKLFRSVSKSGQLGSSITDVDINRVVKRRCKLAGYDESLYSAHSLRSGFITEAGKNGCPIGDVMQLSCHRSISTAMGYYQAGNISNNKAANLMPI